MSTIKVDTITTRTGSGEISLGTTGSQTINRTGNGDLITLQKGGVDSGSISIESSGTAFDGEGSHAGLKMFASAVAPRQNGADVDNTIDLGWTGGRFKDIYLGGGLYVGGTGAANKFEDYEEGTFTPTAVSNTGTLSSSDGHYTKIGQVVFITAYIAYTGASTGASRTYGGLPFPVTNLFAATSVDFQGASWSNAQGSIYFDGGTSNFVDNHGAIRSGSFQANNNTRFQGFYFTT